VQAGEYAERLSVLAAKREPFAVATVTSTEGSTLAKVGFKVVISKDGAIVGGTLGGGCPEGPIVEVARRAMGDGRPRLVRVHLVDAEGAVEGMISEPSEEEIYVETNCGGTLEVFVEPLMPTERLVLVGQGGKDDVEEALISFGKALGLEVVLVSPLPSLSVAPDVVMQAEQIDPAAMALGSRDSVVVLTKGERDVAVLAALSKAKPRFVGLLASRSRLRKDLAELRERGVPEDFLTALHAPVGLDIGAKTPAELAISILADVVATKYEKDVPHKPLDEQNGSSSPDRAKLFTTRGA